MKRFNLLLAGLFLAVASVSSSVAWAQPHEHGGGGHEQGGHEPGRPVAPPHAAPRPEPPRFAPHPAGIHPRGATFHAHPVRVLRPTVIVRGRHEWKHWTHPEFARPAYYWDFGAIHNVSCIAEDSYGDQYPVSQGTYSGFGMANMTEIEDEALDRCYSESGGDQSCYLATCSHF